LLLSTDCRAGVFKVTLPHRKRLCIALGLRFKVGESSFAPTARPTRGFRAYYRIVGTLDDEIRRDPERESTADYCISIADRDRGVTGSRPHETDITHRGTDIDEDIADTGDSTPKSVGTR
ncbi:hypothetical protein Tco_0192713, partial [Tanacetum coccineum]